MDFAPPPTLVPVLDRARAFMTQHVLPLEANMHGPFEDLWERFQPVREVARAEGLWLPQLSSYHGGGGLSVLEHGMLSEVLGHSPLGHLACNCQAPDAGNMEILLEFGTVPQREQFLAPLLAGRTRSCFAMTEPEHAGSNPVWMSTTARREGDEWVIDGHKWFTTGADQAAFTIVMAVTNHEGPPHSRASMILVPLDTPGVEQVRRIAVMGDEGSGWLSHSELRFEDVRVPAGNVLGAEGKGFAIAQARLGPGRIHHCMRWMGICERVFDMMVQRAATRERAPGEFLGDQQIIQEWIATARAEINAARLMVLEAAWTIDNHGAKAAAEKISIIKFYAADVMMRLIDRAIQVHGALGITDDTMLSFFYRHERGARIYDGPDEVHKRVVARKALARARKEHS